MNRIQTIQCCRRNAFKPNTEIWIDIPAHIVPRDSDLMYLQFKIDNVVYTKPSKSFTEAVEKALFWYKLSDKG